MRTPLRINGFSTSAPPFPWELVDSLMICDEVAVVDYDQIQQHTIYLHYQGHNQFEIFQVRNIHFGHLDSFFPTS